MKYTSLVLSTFALFTAGVVAACASGDSALPGGDSGGTGGLTTSNGPGPTSGTGGATNTATNDATTTTGIGGASTTAGVGGAMQTTTTGGGVCVAKCTEDSDCQGSCPPVGNGENCCDAATGVCYVSNMAACPAPNPATTSGSGGSMY